MTQLDDVTKMTSCSIFLKFYYIIINLKAHKMAKSCNFRSPRCKKKNYPIFLQK